ncbi:MAG TPA: hypothetical protein VMU85_01450 [Stellaceae bacterium]|nr:hypothetical protein [Stellaceae bacterium]
MAWWMLWIAGAGTIVVLAVAEIRDMRLLQVSQLSRSGRAELRRAIRERQLEWATIIFFAALTSPALLPVIREVSSILGR